MTEAGSSEGRERENNVGDGNVINDWDSLRTVEFQEEAKTKDRFCPHYRKNEEQKDEIGEGEAERKLRREAGFARDIYWPKTEDETELLMKREFAKLNAERIKYNHQLTKNFSEDDLVAQENIIINTHMCDKKAIEHLMEVFDYSKDEMANRILSCNRSLFLNHFDEAVGLWLKDKKWKDREKAEEEVYELVKRHYIDTKTPKTDDDYALFFDLTESLGKPIPKEVTEEYVLDDLKPKLKGERGDGTIANLRFLSQNGVDMGDVAAMFVGIGQVGKIVENWELFEENGLDKAQFSRRIIDQQKDLRLGELCDLVKHRRELAKKGIDASAATGNLMGLLESGEVDIAVEHRAFFNNVDLFQELGVSIDHVLEKLTKENHILMMASYMDEIDQLKIDNYSKSDIQELVWLDNKNRSVELTNHAVMFDKLPNKVKSEHREIFEQIENGEDKKERKKCLEPFKQEKWENLSGDERVGAVERLSKYLIKAYKICMPCVINFVSPETIGNNVYGLAKSYWVPSGRAEYKYTEDMLGKVGIDTNWLRENRIDLNTKFMDDGSEVVSTIAHELWHAFQDQQCFLRAVGYFEAEAEKTNRLFDTPILGDYYVENRNTYYHAEEKGENDPMFQGYHVYRQQLIEYESFEMGKRYQELMLNGEKPRAGLITKVGKMIRKMKHEYSESDGIRRVE